MYGIYGEIIDAAKKSLNSLEETKELLEYPEVQADKAYYLSVLSKYNELRSLNEKLSALLSALEDEKAYSDMLAEIDGDDERAIVYQEIFSLKRKSSILADSLSDALGRRHIEERAYCRFRLSENSSKFGVALFSLIKTDLLSRGAKIYDENTVMAKGGFAQEISFSAEGVGVIARLVPLVGAHKVYTASSKSEELRFAITPSANVEKVSEDDLKIDIFHSHGAGGQHINKVETAVRVTHLPTGITVVCQDERSQLKNKKRALETIVKRLTDMNEQLEKRRIEADIKEQYSKKNTPISFDAVSNTFTDTRLKAFSKVAFPLASERFNLYMNGLLAL